MLNDGNSCPQTVGAKVLRDAVKLDDTRRVALRLGSDVDGQNRRERGWVGIVGGVKDREGVDLVDDEVEVPALSQLGVLEDDLARVGETCRVDRGQVGATAMEAAAWQRGGAPRGLCGLARSTVVTFAALSSFVLRLISASSASTSASVPTLSTGTDTLAMSTWLAVLRSALNP